VDFPTTTYNFSKVAWDAGSAVTGLPQGLGRTLGRLLAMTRPSSAAAFLLLLVAAVLGSEAGASGKEVTQAGEKAAVLPQHAPAKISAQPPNALAKGPQEGGAVATKALRAQPKALVKARVQGGIAITTKRAQTAHAAHRQGGNIRSAQHVVSWLVEAEGDAEEAASEEESWLLKTDDQGFTNLALIFIVKAFVIFGVTAICCLFLALRHDGADDSRCFPHLLSRGGWARHRGTSIRRKRPPPRTTTGP